MTSGPCTRQCSQASPGLGLGTGTLGGSLSVSLWACLVSADPSIMSAALFSWGRLTTSLSTWQGMAAPWLLNFQVFNSGEADHYLLNANF